MDAQDGFAATSFRQIHRDLPVEAPRPQEGRIEHVRAVRGGQDDNGLIGLEAIQLHQQLLQRLFSFIIAGVSRCATARAPNRVDFIDKDDARSVLLGLLKEIAHAAGPHPDEEFDEVGPTGTIERDAGLAACAISLSRPRRTLLASSLSMKSTRLGARAVAHRLTPAMMNENRRWSNCWWSWMASSPIRPLSSWP